MSVDRGDMADSTMHILLVDDDLAVLDALRRQHGKTFDLVTACGPAAGLEALRGGSFAAVVSDFQMPEMDGIQFLRKVGERAPDVIRLMLTGQADLRVAIDAVNQGHIFRFMTKPCPPEVFHSQVEAALEQYRLRQAERVLLEETVRGSIQVLAEVLSLSNPIAFGRATRIREVVRYIVSALELEDSWQYETAAMLSQIGFVAVPQEVIERLASGAEMTEEQQAILERHPRTARDLLCRIPRLQTVAEIVHNQRADRPVKTSDPRVVMGGRILAVALDMEEMLSQGTSREHAIATLRSNEGRYGSRVLGALIDGFLAVVSDVRQVPLSKLLIGMVLDEDVRSADGTLVVPKGHEISDGTLERLNNYADLGRLVKQSLYIRVGQTSDEDEGAGAALVQ